MKSFAISLDPKWRRFVIQTARHLQKQFAS